MAGKKKMGRPMTGAKTATQAVSFPIELLMRLRDYAKWTGQGISAVVVKAVTRYLDDPDPKG